MLDAWKGRDRRADLRMCGAREVRHRRIDGDQQIQFHKRRRGIGKVGSEIHRCKVQVHVGLARFQHQFASRIPLCFPNLDLFHKDRGFAIPPELPAQVQHGQPFQGSDPELVVGGDRDVGLARGALPGG